jgi:hypothetical protein
MVRNTVTAKAPATYEPGLLPMPKGRIVGNYWHTYPKYTTMPGSIRLDIYRTQNKSRSLTPRQRRRYNHKVNHWLTHHNPA